MSGIKKAVVLLSGGLDSSTVLAIARNEGFDCYCLSFSYGQRHDVELEAARSVARAMQVTEHRTIEIDLREMLGETELPDKEQPVDGLLY